MGNCEHEWEYWEYEQQYFCKKCSATVQARDFARVMSKQLYLLQTQVKNLNKTWDALAARHACLSHLQDVLAERDSLAFKLVIAEKYASNNLQIVLRLVAALELIVKEDKNDTTYEENFGNALALAKEALKEWKGYWK